MAINKVEYAGNVLIDLTNDSVTPETLAKGATAHNAKGEQITGTMESGGGGSVGANNYAKFTAKTDSTTSFVFENPLGGIAKMVSIKAISPTITSSRKIHECCLDWNTRLGAVKANYSSGYVTYVMTGVEGTPNNSNFRMTDGFITAYRFNSATTWDTTCEYEIEIWQ